MMAFDGQGEAIDQFLIEPLSFLNIDRIRQRANRPKLSCARDVCLLNVIAPENVECLFAGRDQIIGDNPPTTSPPQGLCAHDCALRGASQFAQPDQAGMEVLAHGVVRVVMKAPVLAEGIYVCRHVPRPFAQAPERGNMLVSDPRFGQRIGERFRVISRVGV
jgi:hypothetical protein